MGIIVPGGGGSGSGLTQAISDDCIAYYKFEETEELAVALDSKMNFNAVVPASRVAGKIGNGLPCSKDGTNFDANMLLDEIPSSYKVTVDMWFKLTEAIKKGEHGTFTIFSKQWASGMKLYCYFINRLERVELRVCFSYSNADASAETLLFEGATGGSLAANGIFYKVSAVKYIQAIDSTWTIEYDGATKWQVKKRNTLGVQVTHFERVNAVIAGSYTATIYGEGTTVMATALVPRTDEYIIDVGELAAGYWHKLYLLLDLRDDYLSKFGVYFDAAYAGGDTAYLVDLPLNTDISPDLLGGDAANVRIASNDSSIPYLVDGYPFPSSHRYGLPAIVDEVIVSRILLKPITGGTERPKLFLSSQGLGSAAAVPVETDYDLNESVVLTATPAGGALAGWLVNGVDMGDDNPYTLIMTPGDKTVIAVFEGKVATPTASPAGGNYSTAQSVVLSCLTSGATIYYTTNGNTPDNGDTPYTVPISIAAGMTLKAIGIKNTLVDSNVMAEVYTFTLPAPVFNPDGGAGPVDVTMTCNMTGASIYYTTDGSEPDTGDTLYTTPVSVSSDTTLKAKAFKTNYTSSATKTAVYTVSDWVRKTDFGGVARQEAIGIATNSKGYFGVGYNGFSDWWMYDPTTNSWTQKTDFGGGARHDVIGFNVGTKCYVGEGCSSVERFYDFWEYDTVSNLWTLKSPFPGVWRAFSFMFSDGTYGYAGCGIGWSGELYKNFYQYNPLTDVWTAKADFGGGFRCHGVSVGIGVKGYAGLGSSASYPHNGLKDWWEYNQGTNTWTRKADFPGTADNSCAVFSSATACYLVGGSEYNGTISQLDFWKYTVGEDSWVQLADLPFSLSAGMGFAVNGKGYAGVSGNKQFWVYNAL